MTPTPAPTVELTAPPSLAPFLARGALLSPLKRPRPGSDWPRTRLVLPALRADPARLAAYERVCGFPAGGDELPVTYPHVLGFPLAMRLMSGRDFPLPLLGLVHTSIAITRHRATPSAGVHDLTVYIDGLAAHRRGTEAAVVTELRSGGQLVWESRSTYLARQRTSTAPSYDAREPAETTLPTEPRDVREATEAKDATEAAPPEEAPAPLPARHDWHLAPDLGRRYGAASGDRNPIHLYPLTARLFGFPRAIAHGMWTVARCLAAHGAPGATTVRADFRAPVLLPGTVTYAAQDGRFALRGAGGRLHLTGEVRPA
ncbi:hypothetical protein HTV45_02790 [Streptomyces sp. CHD11]|uniref:MaoC family dehydratase n=1 Tax=Streptomyces sp. CHD11 TaxID=2741325 RepID=UPI001BFCBEA5|nr:MaoC/PaaZ C-terminal domain-containing protein [Streptomyces sp. CHD11]MBT3149849.1 hypothetical protein [Streptomyces sp. CHD11]